MTTTCAAVLAVVLASASASAHGMQDGPMMQQQGGMMGPGMMGSGMMGPGMMGPGMPGHGMMGHGATGPGMMGSGMMGPGMMGPGMMGPGMMGHGAMGPGMMGYCPMMGYGGQAIREMDLTVDQVAHMMGHQIAMSGNPNLKLGDVTERDADSITADVVTQDGSLVRRFVFDRHTGAFHPADREQ